MQFSMLIVKLWGVGLENKIAEIVVLFALELQNIVSNKAKNIFLDMYTCVLSG